MWTMTEAPAVRSSLEQLRNSPCGAHEQSHNPKPCWFDRVLPTMRYEGPSNDSNIRYTKKQAEFSDGVSKQKREIEASIGSVLLRTDTDSFLFKRSCSMLAALSGWRGIMTVNISGKFLMSISWASAIISSSPA